MKYLLFEKSAVEVFVSKTVFQSVDFPEGMELVNAICGTTVLDKLDGVLVHLENDRGVFFVGNGCSKTFLLFDLTQCKIMDEKSNPESLLLVFQKVFRTAMRVWNNQPFTSSERIHGSKSIVFPFVFTDRRRIVIERAAKSDRLMKRGIERPLLAYKYGVDDAPQGEEIAGTDILREAGELYLANMSDFQKTFRSLTDERNNGSVSKTPLVHANATQKVSDGGFMYLTFEQQFSKLTTTQKAVVKNENIIAPIRIDGPAGTGKTASMILRAYYLLQSAKNEGRPFKIIFFAHSESTKSQIESAFLFLDNTSIFTSKNTQQQIKFTTLFSYCVETIRVNSTQVIERDAADAKQSQRMLIEEALDKVYDEKYKTFKPLLSLEMKNVFDKNTTPKGILISMLQHEFSVQIKGRTDGTIEEYYQLSPISNALPTITKKDKEFVFSIFHEYQNMLKVTSVYDIDDITVQALAQWNAPIWRRERSEQGFDYIFVDEMHLFNVNERNAFHYLTKSAEQKQIPICFALDHSQAIGDRGNKDDIETVFGDAERSKYKTVFRCSQQITDFCAAISASGALMFKNNYKDPYDIAASGFTQHEDALCEIPILYMYNDEEAMLNSIKLHIDKFKRELQCKNHEIALISFEESLLCSENMARLNKIIGREVVTLRDRQTSHLDKAMKSKDSIVLSDPYNINGLEFKCVILVGVDEGRVPQNVGVSDISANYIKYIAFNQLYLASSRAKYRLILLGNNLHGSSSCLQYALKSGALQMGY